MKRIIATDEILRCLPCPLLRAYSGRIYCAWNGKALPKHPRYECKLLLQALYEATG